MGSKVDIPITIVILNEVVLAPLAHEILVLVLVKIVVDVVVHFHLCAPPRSEQHSSATEAQGMEPMMI
jgi:hypothetical protein